MAVNDGQYSHRCRKDWRHQNLVRQKNAEITIDRACQQRVSSKENGSKRDPYTDNQKETTEISGTYSEEKGLGERHTQGI